MCQDLKAGINIFCKELKEKMCVEAHGAMEGERWKAETKFYITFTL